MASNPRAPPGHAPGRTADAGPWPSSDIGALPDAFDKEIAVIFHEMREASGLGKAELARRLSTSPRTLDALEEGALLGLPSWSETSRIVLAYTQMLQLDPQPILRRIQSQLATLAPQRLQHPRDAHAPPRAGLPNAGAAPPGEAAATVRVPISGGGHARDEALLPGEAPAPGEAPHDMPPRFLRSGPARARQPDLRRQRIGLGAIVGYVVLFAALAAAAFAAVYAAQRPALVLSVTDSMPEPIARAARSVLQAEPAPPAPALPDPRERKEDRLPVRGEDGMGLR